MHNQIAIRIHCKPGDEFLCEENCHVYNYEQGAFAQLSGIVAQFGITVEENSFVAHLEALNAHLLEHRHRVSTLIIDDAHALSEIHFEQLRLISNLEVAEGKLLQIVLCGQQDSREPGAPDGELYDFADPRLIKAGWNWNWRCRPH